MVSNQKKDNKTAIIEKHFDSNLVFQEHKARYEFAKAFVKGRSVLDLGCGIGHGTEMLTGEAKKIVGVEIDSMKLNPAHLYFNRKNIDYLVADARFLPFKENIFDTVISLEVIEHLIEHDEYLMGIKRVLNLNGKAIISTPDKEIIKLEGTVSNATHVKELTHSEFKALLSRYFNRVEIHGQTRRKGVKGVSGILYHVVIRLDIFKIRAIFSRSFKNRILKKIARTTGAKDPSKISAEDVSVLKGKTRWARNLIGVCEK